MDTKVTRTIDGEMDGWPGTRTSVGHDGQLKVVNEGDGEIVALYEAGEWTAVECHITA